MNKKTCKHCGAIKKETNNPPKKLYIVIDKMKLGFKPNMIHGRITNFKSIPYLFENKIDAIKFASVRGGDTSWIGEVKLTPLNKERQKIKDSTGRE